MYQIHLVSPIMSTNLMTTSFQYHQVLSRINQLSLSHLVVASSFVQQLQLGVTLEMIFPMQALSSLSLLRHPLLRIQRDSTDFTVQALNPYLTTYSTPR